MSSNMDELLRRALMEANALDAEEISAPPGRSAHYQRERLRLCASPFGWARQQAKPLWKRMLRGAACFLLIGTLLFGTLMAASPTVRAAVARWFTEYSETGRTMAELFLYRRYCVHLGRRADASLYDHSAAGGL